MPKENTDPKGELPPVWTDTQDEPQRVPPPKEQEKD